MREKFKRPSEPNEQEKQFIRLIEQYNKVSVGLFRVYIENASQRKLRKFMERYNNYKFIGYKPIGEIHQVKDRFVLIKPDDHKSDYYRLKAEYDFVCGIIARKNNQRTLGKRQAKGQLRFKDLIKLNTHQLEEYANNLANIIEDEQ